MKKFIALVISIFLLMSFYANAQYNKKISPALANFNNTEFMLKFHDLGIEAESTVKGVIENQQKFNSKDLRNLRTAYDQSVQRANTLLSTIKQDFLDKKKLKMISEYPDMYTDGLRYKLDDLSDFYANNFQQTLADAGGMENDGSAILLLVTELIGLTKGLIDYYQDIKKEAKRYNDAYLNLHFYEPYRWKTWEEINGNKSFGADDFEEPETNDSWEVDEEPADSDEESWGDWETGEEEVDWDSWDEGLDTLNHNFLFENVEGDSLKTKNKSPEGN